MSSSNVLSKLESNTYLTRSPINTPSIVAVDRLSGLRLIFAMPLNFFSSPVLVTLW